MARRTKKQDAETIEVFYGINPATHDVDSVYLTRGGVLSKHGRSGYTATHHVLPGRLPRNEIIIVWDLTDVISFPIGLHGSELVKEQLAELQKKAAEMKTKAAAQVKPSQSPT